MTKRNVSRKKKKTVKTKAGVRTKRLNKNRRYKRSQIFSKSKSSKSKSSKSKSSRKTVTMRRGALGIKEMFMSPIQWPVKDPTSSLNGELVSPDKRRDSVKYKWEEKQCEIVDISEIVERYTQPGVPNIVTILPLSTHDYWPNLSTEI